MFSQLVEFSLPFISLWAFFIVSLPHFNLFVLSPSCHTANFEGQFPCPLLWLDQLQIRGSIPPAGVHEASSQLLQVSCLHWRRDRTNYSNNLQRK